MMNHLRRSPATWILGSLLVAGISGCTSPVGIDDDDTSSTSAAVSDGTADFTHTGVGAIVYRSGGHTYVDCSGFLVSPTVFVTAAHCKDPTNPNPPYVTFDQNVTDQSPLHSGTIYIHPDYPQRNNGDIADVGVFVLDQPVSGYQISRLPTRNQLDTLRHHQLVYGANIRVVGYGRDRVARQETQPTGQRISGNVGYHSFNSGYVMASQLAVQGYSGVCFGDSGGPDYFTVNGQEIAISLNQSISDPYCQTDAWLERLDTDVARSFLGNYVTLP